MTTAHEALVAAMTTPGGAPVRAYLSDGTLWLSMAGQTFPLHPDGHTARGDLAATVYTTKHGTAAGADDVLTVADDGTVYRLAHEFETSAAPVCRLDDVDPRASIVSHLAAVLASRALQ
jgi:hypothetical protein